MSAPGERVAEALREAGCGRAGPGAWTCPAHEDGKASLSVSVGRDGRVLLHCHAGCELGTILAAAGLTMADLFDGPPAGSASGGRRIVEAYPYVGEMGELLYEVVRFAPKDFRQRRPDGHGGWTWKLGDVRRVLYRLPAVIAAASTGATVYVVEGEKDVHAIEAAGGVATCNPGGAGKWRLEYAEALRGARVVIVADGDEPGRAHAGQVAEALQGVATAVEVVQARTGKDVADHLAAGHGLADLVPMASAIDLDPEAIMQEAPQAAASSPGVDRASVPPFPLDALPAAATRLVRERAAAVPCPPDFVAVPMLAAAAAAIGATRRLRLRDGYHESSRLYLASCGPPGSGKSPGFRAALAPAWAWQRAAREEYRAKRAEYERAMAEHEAAVEAWRNQARAKGGQAPPGRPEPPAEPVMGRAVVEDVTVEALAPVLEANPRGVILASDELAGWVNAIGQYKSGPNGDRQRWLTLWTGQPLTIDRKKAEPIMVDRPFVVVTGGIQPDALGVLIGDRGADDGFVDRVLVAYPDPMPLVVSDAGTSAAAQEGWAEVFERLRALVPGTEGEPLTLTFSDQAAADWRAWRERLCEQRNAAPPALAGALAKLEAHAGRLVLVAHELRRAAGEGGSPTTVDAKSLRRGLALADYFAGHFPRVYGRLADTRALAVSGARGAPGPVPERRAELAARVLGELGRCGGALRLADVARAVGADPKDRTVRTALAELLEAGRVEREGDRYSLASPDNPTLSTPCDTPHEYCGVAGCTECRVPPDGEVDGTAAVKSEPGSESATVADAELDRWERLAGRRAGEDPPAPGAQERPPA